MDRAFAAGASASPPATPVSPSIGYPTAGNPATGTQASKPGPWFYHMLLEELIGVIVGAGIAPSHTDLSQLARAIQGGRLSCSVASGTADELTASFSPSINELVDGIRLIVRAAAENITAEPTFTPAHGVLDAKIIVKAAGVQLDPGDIAGEGHWLVLQYDEVLDKWVLGNPAIGHASTDVRGKVQLATSAEAQTMIDEVKAITPFTLGAAFGGINKRHASNGYQRLPGGLIIQWGNVSVADTPTAYALPIAFPNAFLQVLLSDGATASNIQSFSAEPSSLSAFTAMGSGNGFLTRYLAIGF